MEILKVVGAVRVGGKRVELPGRRVVGAAALTREVVAAAGAEGDGDGGPGINGGKADAVGERPAEAQGTGRSGRGLRVVAAGEEQRRAAAQGEVGVAVPVGAG